MNLLAHFWLADRTHTSFAGQLLGDEIKGRLDGRFDALVAEGIRLHRTIDTTADEHSVHRALRATFVPPLRRYAPILVDIGLDHVLARDWHEWHDETLDTFARRAEAAVIDEWPASAPFAATQVSGLRGMLVDYARPAGIQRALVSVHCRLRRRNPVADALPALQDRHTLFADALPAILASLEQRVFHGVGQAGD